VPQIPTVIEHPGEERVGGDPAGDLGGDRADPGDHADLTRLDVLPAPGDDLVADQNDELRATAAARRGGAGQQPGVGVGEVAREGLGATVSPRAAMEAGGLGLGRLTIGVPTWGSKVRWMSIMPRSSVWLRASTVLPYDASFSARA
jgi:hypothetical protein